MAEFAYHFAVACSQNPAHPARQAPLTNEVPVHELQLDLPAGPGRRRAVEHALREAIRSGRLGAGSALPSSRVLAADIGVSRSTIVGAYEQLTAEGYLVSRQGRGTTVASVAAPEAPAAADDLMGARPRWDFRPGEPDASSFPRRGWARAVRRAISETDDEALSYPDPRGRIELRSTLAGHLGRTRSVVTDQRGIFVSAGFAAALGFLADTFRRRGVTTIAAEAAMLPIHRWVLRGAGLDVVTVEVDDQGIRVDQLEQSGATIVLVTPANQYPFGVTMTPERRAGLIEWAETCDGLIIEDDYDGEFRFDGRPIGALQGLAPHRVIYAGTASKALGAGLRMGWLAVPERLRSPLVHTAGMRNGVSAFDQIALAEFIDRGDLDRHVRLMRRSYATRRAELIAVLDEFAGLHPALNGAGLHLCVPLGSAALEQRVLRAGLAADVGLLGLVDFHRAAPDRAGLALGFTRPARHAWPTALERLGEMLETVPELRQHG